MVSVCVATYNGGRFISEMLESVLTQIGLDDEIIVSDDGSTDDTTAKIEGLKDSRIRILHHDGNKSVVRNFENALQNSSGSIIFLADQDDVWLPGKLQKMVRILESCEVAVSDCHVVDTNLNIIKFSLFDTLQSGSGLLRNLYKNSYIGCCMAMRREVLDRALPFPADLPMHDWWIGLVAEAAFRTEFIAEPLMLYRRHDTNASLTGDKSSFSVFRKLVWRLVLVKNLVCRLWAA